jgi:hypothetical protein
MDGRTDMTKLIRVLSLRNSANATKNTPSTTAGKALSECKFFYMLAVIFRRFRNITKSFYYLHDICLPVRLSVRPHETNRRSLEDFYEF